MGESAVCTRHRSLGVLRFVYAPQCGGARSVKGARWQKLRPALELPQSARNRPTAGCARAHCGNSTAALVWRTCLKQNEVDDVSIRAPRTSERRTSRASLGGPHRARHARSLRRGHGSVVLSRVGWRRPRPSTKDLAAARLAGLGLCAPSACPHQQDRSE